MQVNILSTVWILDLSKNLHSREDVYIAKGVCLIESVLWFFKIHEKWADIRGYFYLHLYCLDLCQLSVSGLLTTRKQSPEIWLTHSPRPYLKTPWKTGTSCGFSAYLLDCFVPFFRFPLLFSYLPIIRPPYTNFPLNFQNNKLYSYSILATSPLSGIRNVQHASWIYSEGL